MLFELSFFNNYIRAIEWDVNYYQNEKIIKTKVQ